MSKSTLKGIRTSKKKNTVELFIKWLEKNIEKYISSHGLEGEDYYIDKGELAKDIYLYFRVKIK